jgi:hypothetical protein
MKILGSIPRKAKSAQLCSPPTGAHFSSYPKKYRLEPGKTTGNAHFLWF